jgi:hypothetical protein
VDEIGEPPGVWTGRACPQLGLIPGAEVEPAVMERLYGELLDPRDPAFADPDVPAKDKARLGSAPRRYQSAAELLAAKLAAEPGATPERVEQLEIEARTQARSAVMFFDFTFSVDKSTSILHASLQAAAARAEKAGEADQAAEYARQAGIVEEAIRAGSAAAIEYLQDEAGYSRTGYHSGIPRDEHGRPLAEHGTGRWVDAHEWVVASFFQHTSRDGDPQLHVHNAILNRVQCADGVWRTIDSRAVHRQRAAASAVGGRVMDEMISRELSAAYAQRPDGHGRELTGVPQPVKDFFSSRRVAITAGVAELAAAYEAKHGRAPSARALFSMGQYVTLHSRRAKPRHEHAVPRAVALTGWEAEMRAAELGALTHIPGRVVGSLDVAAAPGIGALGDAELRRLTEAAIAELQAARAVWTRSHLMAAIDAHLPGWLGGLDEAAVRRVLGELTDQALSPAGGYGVLCTEAAELVSPPSALRRPDGRSAYSPHDDALYTTKPQLDAEEQLVAAAGRVGGPAADRAQVAAAMGATAAELDELAGRVPGQNAPAARAAKMTLATADPQDRSYGAGLRPDQAAAVYGIMTSGRLVDILIGPAGTGKSYAMGTLAELWRACTGGQVIGVATSENAAQVLGAEIGAAQNIARFLAQAAAGRAGLAAGDLLIVDEAGMVDTAQLTALHRLAADAGAKMLLTGDPAQLPSVGAGGMLGLLARQYGYYQLTQVQRMAEEWEQEASLRLRAGEAGVLADYDRHGRLLDGTAEEMATAAYRAWLADHLSGKDSLLIAATNSQAADLAARARADLVALGLVDEHGIELRDGNTAGVGDLVQARRNDHDITDQDDRWVANRDVWRVEAIGDDPDTDEAPILVRRYLGRDQDGERRWSAPFPVRESYLCEHVELAYATTVHAAQGRTVDTCHALVSELLDRALLYVAMTRGRLANYAYIGLQTVGGHRPPHVPNTGQRVQRRSADLRPGTRPADATTSQDDGQDTTEAAAPEPARIGPDPAAPWAPEADRLSVLAGILERDSTAPPALQVLRDDLARVRHLSHLGAIWTDLAAEESGRRYDATLRRVLTAEQYQRVSSEDARNTLFRLLRSAELAGHDPAALLTQAVGLRSLDADPHRGRASNISKTLHSRVREITHDPLPRPASYVERTPPAADPEIGAYLLEVARLRDQRATELGERAAANPPAWAVEHFGPVPEDPQQRADWTHRAGIVAAYRLQYGRTGHIYDQDPIGREPAAPEARADWHDAYAALGRPADQRAMSGASDGELLAIQARYEREVAWAPPHVGAELRQTALARREHQTEVSLTRARAQASAGAERDELLAAAQGHEQIAEALAAREQDLAHMDTERARWHEATTQIREQVTEASTELRRRWPEAGQLPQPTLGWEPEREPTPDGIRQPAADKELHRAAEAAARARRTLQAQDAEWRVGEQRRRNEPGPARWPHRDPGYPAPRREAREPKTSRERTAAQQAAQDFPAPPHPSPAEPPAPEPPRRQPSPPSLTSVGRRYRHDPIRTS